MNEQIIDSSLIENSEFSFENRMEEIEEYGYSVNIMQYINHAFAIFGKNVFGYIGFLLLFFIASMLLSFLSWIPVAGMVIHQIVVGCLAAGFYIVANKISTNKLFSFSNFFGGFEFFIPLAVKSLILLLLIALLFVPLIFSSLFFTSELMEMANMIQAISNLGGVILLVVLAILSLILVMMMLWMFASMNILFAKKNAWKSMEMSRKVVQKRFLSFFLFMLSIFILNIFGTLMLLIGLLVTIPISIISIYCAWEDIMITQGRNTNIK